MTEDWSKWESLVINGVYPLRRFLTRSDHSVVFLTEYTANAVTTAAIKLIPADPATSEAQLARWNAVAALSHPHLIRLLDVGRCQLGGHPFLFVVMEYAEQTLAQLLPRRALTLDEVREMLPPAIDALAFLHSRNLVHGRLKPPNFLVVNDQLKLSSDAVRPAESTGGVTAAGDIRDLGATLIEALTQFPPTAGTEAALTDILPKAFADTLRRCLSANPADRPTITNLDAELKGASPTPAISPPPAATAPIPVAPVAAAAPRPAAPRPAAPAQTLPRKRLLVPVIAAATLVLLVAAWAGSHLFHGKPQALQPALNSPSPESQPAASSAASATDSTPSSPAPSPVIHQEIPGVSRSARASIRGTIKVAVLVTVDRSGKVIAQDLERRGSSRYFAHMAGEAAKKWRFTQEGQDSRRWLLQFEFTRAGTTAHAAPKL
ncbi:MAG: protein kinase [Gammaproteobacteria bacterium]